MQPIIDIIYEKCEDYIDAYLAAHPPACSFVDRGDPGSADWSELTLTGDNSWRDLDLSSIVPIDTNFVLLRVSMKAAYVTRKISFRKKGNTGWPTMADCRLLAASLPHHYDKTVAVSADRMIQYRLNSPDWAELWVTVAGWHVGNYSAAGFVNRGDPATFDFEAGDLVFDSAWHDLDLSGIIPLSTKAILINVKLRTVDIHRWFGLRTHGNSNDVNVSHVETLIANEAVFNDFVVPTDGLQSIDYSCNPGAGAEVDFTVKGWWL